MCNLAPKEQRSELRNAIAFTLHPLIKIPKDWDPNSGMQSRSLCIPLRRDALCNLAPEEQGSELKNAIAFTLHPFCGAMRCGTFLFNGWGCDYRNAVAFTPLPGRDPKLRSFGLRASTSVASSSELRARNLDLRSLDLRGSGFRASSSELRSPKLRAPTLRSPKLRAPSFELR